MIHSANPQSQPAVKICLVLVDFEKWGRTYVHTYIRTDMYEYSDHYRPGLRSATWIKIFFCNFRHSKKGRHSFSFLVIESILIHSADPQSRPLVIIIFTHFFHPYVCMSVRPSSTSFQNIAK